MQKEPWDVVVIGGGVVGCAVARELSRYALRILLLEKTADICNGQSKANTAIVHGGYDALNGTAKAKFNVSGNAMYDAICAELDVPFARNTSLVVSFAAEDDAKLYALLERGKKNGVPGLHILERDAVLAREPNLNPALTRALLAETGGIVCPYELTVAYAENAARNGVEFIRNAEVTALEKTPQGYTVRSTAGSFLTRAVVNCAGLYADVINNMVSEDKLHIHPRRGEYYIVDKSCAGAFHAAIFQVPSAMGKGILVAPTVDGTLLIGPTAEDIEDKRDTRTTATGLEKALSGARLSWPQIPTRSFITEFSGLRAHCDRNDFVIGEAIDAPLFFNAAGIESPGLTSAPAIGVHLAKEVAERLEAKEKTDFDPKRKGIPKFRELDDAARAALIAKDPDYAKIVCRCEMVTEAEIRQSIRRPVGARTMDGVKRRTRAGMGRCQAGFCTPRVMELLSEELGVAPEKITKCGGASKLITGRVFEGQEHDA